MNEKAFQKYLATGEYVSAMDEASLSPTEYTKSFLEHFGYVPGYQPSRTYRECADAIASECAIRAPHDTAARDKEGDAVLLLVASGDAECEEAGRRLGDCMMANGKHDEETLMQRMSDAYKALIGLAVKAEETKKLPVAAEEVEDSGIDWKKDPGVQETLAGHDARFHPNGYKEGDKCKFRERLQKGDLADSFLDDIRFDAEEEEKADQDKSRGIDYLKLSGDVNKMVGESMAKIKEGVPENSAERGWIGVANCGGVGKTPVPYGLISISGYCGTKEQFDKKVATAKDNAEKAAAYLTEKTGTPWRIYAKELYDKDDEPLDESANWKDIHDVTFLLSGDTTKVNLAE